jgi:hypothetical protein
MKAFVDARKPGFCGRNRHLVWMRGLFIGLAGGG